MGEPPTSLFLPEATLQEFGATGNWGYQNFSVGDDGVGKSLSCDSQGTPMAEQEGNGAGLKGWSRGLLGKGTQLRQGRAETKAGSVGGNREAGGEQESDLAQQRPWR